jgi:hypothetical protein
MREKRAELIRRMEEELANGQPPSKGTEGMEGAGPMGAADATSTPDGGPQGEGQEGGGGKGTMFTIQPIGEPITKEYKAPEPMKGNKLERKDAVGHVDTHPEADGDGDGQPQGFLSPDDAFGHGDDLDDWAWAGDNARQRLTDMLAEGYVTVAPAPPAHRQHRVIVLYVACRSGWLILIGATVTAARRPARRTTARTRYAQSILKHIMPQYAALNKGLIIAYY